jgi:transcriptional regulator with XRE-family HTH domain
MKVKKARRKGMIQYLGVAEVARMTGLTVGHVSQVLRGLRQSDRVLRAAKGRVTFVGEGTAS